MLSREAKLVSGGGNIASRPHHHVWRNYTAWYVNERYRWLLYFGGSSLVIALLITGFGLLRNPGTPEK
jgi:hypothetical protein